MSAKLIKIRTKMTTAITEVMIIRMTIQTQVKQRMLKWEV